jgi:hypothetical protein
METTSWTEEKPDSKEETKQEKHNLDNSRDMKEYTESSGERETTSETEEKPNAERETELQTHNPDG